MNESSVRLDQWLSAARIFKSRTAAQEACTGGRIRVNGRVVRSSHPVRAGDKIEGNAPRGRVILVVLDVEEKRQSPVRARELYEDHSPPPPPKELELGVRDRGAGRPTKADRRKIERFRGGF